MSAGDEVEARLAKAAGMRTRGDDPYPVRFDRTHAIGEVREHWEDRLADGDSTEDVVRVAGRVLLLRDQGRLVFVTVRDGSGTIQLFVSKGDLGEAFDRLVADVDRGDWIGVTGTVMKTKRGELSVRVSEATMLAKALRPLPEKWHGLSDTETRYRRRYVDLIANDEARRVFDVRFAAVSAIRAFLGARGSPRSRRRCCT